MSTITHRQYRLLCDHPAIYQFMLDIYERDWRNGVAAPFLEYALMSSWMTKDYVHRNRIWEDDGKIVAFVFTESPAWHSYFSLRPGYEQLAPEMIRYAHQAMPREDGKLMLCLFESQTALRAAAEAQGYVCVERCDDLQYDFAVPLVRPVPAGYHVVPPEELETAKIMECCWKGFNHEEEEGPWPDNTEEGRFMATAPHFTGDLACVIASDAGEYCCYAGMWWTPQNKLAYMEPLCTVPAHRHKGLAGAALSELYRRMKPLGATHMTGGGNPFYQTLGYGKGITWTKYVEAKYADRFKDD